MPRSLIDWTLESERTGPPLPPSCANSANTTALIVTLATHQKKNVSRLPRMAHQSNHQPAPSSTHATIRKVLSPQPTFFDYQFLKPQSEISDSDPDVWGHIMEGIDHQKIMRVLLQTPNGIKPHITEYDFLFGLRTCEELGVGFLGLSEKILNWSQAHHIISTRRCFKKTWQHSSIQMSQQDEAFSKVYQPGGTMSAIVGPWTSRVIEHGSDPHGLGRWSFIIMRGKADRRVAIVTSYRVCHRKTAGPKIAYRQQFCALSKLFRDSNIARQPDPHRQCILDLQG